MNFAHGFVIAVIILSGQTVSAQDLLRYRDFVLESSVDTVAAVTGVRATEAQTLHERPAKIQELQWRAPYVNPASATADPVRDVAFAFFNDALYQVVVTYNRDRTEGLTNDDIIESLSASYGAPGTEVGNCANRSSSGRTPRQHRAGTVEHRRFVVDATPRYLLA